MKKLPLFLAILMAPLLFSSCANWADYSKRVGVSRPKPEGRAVKIAFGAYDADVHENCVHFYPPPNLGLLYPQEVWVYNLDRDPAGTFDSVWIRPEGPESWEFRQKAKLPPGSTAVPDSAQPDAFIDWVENAYQARNHANKRRLQSGPPAAVPLPEQARPVPQPKYDYKTYERPGT